MLHALGVVAASSLAGCPSGDYGRHRILEFGLIQILEQHESAYTLEVEMIKSASGETEKWETFHDVRLLGFTKTGEPVCEKALGDVSDDGTERTETVECTGFPFIFTFDAAESPCEDNTTLMVSTYQGTREGNHYWLSDRQRQCNEGLPPTIPDTTVTPPS